MENEPLAARNKDQDDGTQTQSNLPVPTTGSEVVVPGVPSENGCGVIPAPEVEFELPEGYSLDDAGLWYAGKSDSEPERICGPFRVLGQTRDGGSTNWGLAIELDDQDGQTHHHIIPRSSLITAGQDALRDLAGCGLDLPTKPSSLARLKEALMGIRTVSRVRLVETTGWHGSVFVMTNQIIGRSDELFHYTGSRAATRFGSAGSLDDWKGQVATLAAENRLLLLAISVALSGPLFGLLREMPIGIHLRGPSSCGKTTALTAAGSIWGGGGRNGFCGTWRATANGLEGAAAAHSETCLVLDELGEIEPQEAGKAAYALLNGSGKQRAGRSGEPRPRLEWRVPVLSSGEITLADKIGEDRGKPARVGVDVRIIDVAADAGEGMGIFECLHGRANGAVFCDQLREAALNNYGTAGPKFVHLMAGNLDGTIEAAKRLIDESVSAMTAGISEGQLHRVARQLAIIGTAGELARGALDLDWGENETIDAAVKTFAEWVAGRGKETGEFTRALQALRAAIDSHGESRFDDLRPGEALGRFTIRDRLGFRCRVRDQDCWGFTSAGWREIVTPAGNPTDIAKQLKKRDMLLPDSEGKSQVVINVRGVSTRVYAIPSEVLEGIDVLS
jgi:putative DNA primase/helicase